MAEYGWALSDDLTEKAEKELNEYVQNRYLAVDAVKELTISRPDIEFLRTDSSFILRFLRARKFDVHAAFKLYARYFEYRQLNRQLFDKFSSAEPQVKAALMDAFPGVLDQTDQEGRKILVIFTANWDLRSYGLSAIYRAILLSLEKLIEEESLQINGFVIILDWSQFSFKQSTWIQPKLLKLMIDGLQDCFPARFSAVHFINQPWYVEAIVKVVKPFLKEKTKQKMFMHGNNLATLYENVPEDILPAELGGPGPPYNLSSWAKTLIGDENFSFGEKHIYWPDHSSCIKTRSETFPLDQYTTEVATEDRHASRSRPDLDELFLVD